MTIREAPPSLAARCNELEHLRLDRHIQGCRGLVSDEELGVAAQGHGDHDPLAHAAAELVRVVVDAGGSIGNSHQPQKLNGSILGLLRRHAHVEL